MTKLIVVLVFLSTGCASTYKAAEKKPIENEKFFNQSFDKVWSKIVSFVSSTGMNVKTIDKASGLIGFEKGYDSSSAYFDCGRYESPAMSTKEKEESRKKPATEQMKVSGGTVNMNFFVERISEKETKVKINSWGKVSFPVLTGLYGIQSGGGEATCYSTGAFENEVFNSISK